MAYFKSLPDEKGYLKKNIQELEQQIANLRQQQRAENFTHSQIIHPKR
ncbi:MAG: hypothetical protein NY202_05270 [Mollicutes bacterium UO1]